MQSEWDLYNMIVHWSLEVMVTLVIMMVIMVYRVEDGCTREKERKEKKKRESYITLVVLKL